MDGDTLADQVVVADLHARVSAPVGEILRSATDRHERADRIELAQLHRTEQTDVTEESRPPADLHVGSDDATGADEHVLGQPRTRIHASRLRDRTCHERVPLSLKEGISQEGACRLGRKGG